MTFKTRILAVLCALVIVLSFAACNAASTNNTENNTGSPANTENAQTGTQSNETTDSSATNAPATEGTIPEFTEPAIPVGTATQPLSIAPPYADTSAFSLDELYGYYDDAVFVGDSISLGWRNYVTKQRNTNPNFMGKAQFLVSGSLGAANAMWEVSDESVHPMYQGEQMQLWNSIPLTGAKKVYIMFGLNDIGRYSDVTEGVKTTVDLYDQLIQKIKSTTPGVEVCIISATYVIQGGDLGKLTSSNLYALNLGLIDYCNAKGIEFINITDKLTDSAGCLASQYCSDGFVHQTEAAYMVWTEVLKANAASHL